MFSLITRVRFKILIFCVFEIEERLVMFNLALKNVFAKQLAPEGIRYP